MPKTANFSFRIDPALKEDLRVLAADDRRSLANYIENILRSHVENEKRKKSNHPSVGMHDPAERERSEQ